MVLFRDQGRADSSHLLFRKSLSGGRIQISGNAQLALYHVRTMINPFIMPWIGIFYFREVLIWYQKWICDDSNQTKVKQEMCIIEMSCHQWLSWVFFQLFHAFMLWVTKRYFNSHSTSSKKKWIFIDNFCFLWSLCKSEFPFHYEKFMLMDNVSINVDLIMQYCCPTVIMH